MTKRLPPRVHESDLRDPERWLKEHVFNSDENERAYEAAERSPTSRPVSWKDLLAPVLLIVGTIAISLGHVSPEGLV